MCRLSTFHFHIPPPPQLRRYARLSSITRSFDSLVTPDAPAYATPGPLPAAPDPNKFLSASTEHLPSLAKDNEPMVVEELAASIGDRQASHLLAEAEESVGVLPSSLLFP